MKANESVDKLFSDPFEPLWMKRQREAKEQEERERLELLTRHYTQRRPLSTDELQFNADRDWRTSAARSHLRIVARCHGSRYWNA